MTSVVRASRNAVRDVAKKYFPRAVAGSRTLRYFATSKVTRVYKDRGAGGDVGRKFGWRVLGGPFEGLKFPWWMAGNTMPGPKLLGCYEEELHPIVKRIIATGYPTIINVGSAEGYYTVGFALRMPNTRIISYEADPVMSMLCRDLARENGVEGCIEMRRFCSPAELRGDPLDNAYLIIDVEGYEMTLCDPVAVPGLVRSDFLVERHDGVDASITKTLIARFGATHDYELIDLSPDRHVPVEMPDDRRVLASSEFRKNSIGWIEFRRRR